MGIQEEMIADTESKNRKVMELGKKYGEKLGKYVITLIKTKKRGTGEKGLTAEEQDANGLISMQKLQGYNGENDVTIMDPVTREVYDFFRSELRNQKIVIQHSIEVMKDKETGEQVVAIAYKKKDRDIMSNFLNRAMQNYAGSKDSISKTIKKKQKEIEKNKSKQKEKKRSHAEHGGR